MKSRKLSLILTTLFGSLGLLYTNPLSAIVLTLFSIMSYQKTHILIIFWGVSIFLGDFFVNDFNEHHNKDKL